MTRRIPVLASCLAAAAATCTVVVAATGPVGAVSADLREARAPFVESLDGQALTFATGAIFSSAAVGDVTGDGADDIVVGSLNTIARVYDLAGAREIELNPGGAIPAAGNGASQSSPALGDIDGDGVDDVVITNTGGRVAAYSVVGGTPRELYNRYSEPAFQGALIGAFGTPALGYVDGDLALDAVTTSWGQTVDVWSGPTGAPLPDRRQWLRDTIWSSPVIGDVDGDGKPEIVVGADCDGSGTPQPCYGIGKGGYVWAFNLDGSVQWSHFVRDAVVWSTPALVDLNGDGALDVVVGTGLYFLGPAANRMMAFDGRNGQPLWEAPTGGPTFGSPAVATVNGQIRIWSVVGGGNVMSWDAAGNLLWQTCVVDGTCVPAAGTFGGVAIADIDADGTLEAVTQAEQRMKVLNAVTGEMEADERSSYPSTLFASYATPTIASVGGETWIIQVNIGDRNGNLATDGGDDLVLSVWTTGTGLGDAPWPTFKKNMARTGGPLPEPPPQPVGRSGRECARVAGSEGGGAFVNLTPVEAAGPGYGLLVSSDVTNPPDASNVNYNTGTTDPNVAIAPIGTDGRVCYANGPISPTHLIADHLGTIDADAYTPATTTGAPARKIDTRIGLGGPVVAPSGRICFTVNGQPGDAAIVNLTPVDAGGPGFGLLVSSNVTNPPDASNVNYNTGTTDPNVAIAPIGTDGRVCYANGPISPTHLIADHLGTIDADAYTPATTTGAPARKIDTRIGLGGPIVAPSGRICFTVNGQPGDAAIVNLTPVDAGGPGFGLLVSSDVTNPPDASNVNYTTGTTDPNVAIAPIGNDGRVCYANGPISPTHLIADHLGTIDADAYTPATTTGAPARKIDTRIDLRD
jgi:hypothetical protein